MTKAAIAPKRIVSLKGGGTVELRGYGVLKGKLEMAPGIDLTKPIYEQVMRKTSTKATASES